MGDPDPTKQPRRAMSMHRAQVVVMGRIQYWQRSGLVRRIQAGDVVNQGLLLGAVLLLCFLPLLLVLQSTYGRNDASGFIRRLGLTGEAAHAVRQALTSPTTPTAAFSALNWVLFILFGVATAGAIQGLYEKVFGVQGNGFRDAPRRVVWLAIAVGISVVGAWSQPWLHDVGGTGLVAIASFPSATAFWWFSMWLLLGGKLSWRELFPSALATGVCWLGMVLVFRLTLSSSIASDYEKYGSAGVVLAIMPLLIAIGVVLVLGAILGVAWRERREHPPGEQPDLLLDPAGMPANGLRCQVIAELLQPSLPQLRRSAIQLPADRRAAGLILQVLVRPTFCDRTCPLASSLHLLNHGRERHSQWPPQLTNRGRSLAQSLVSAAARMQSPTNSTGNYADAVTKGSAPVPRRSQHFPKIGASGCDTLRL